MTTMLDAVSVRDDILTPREETRLPVGVCVAAWIVCAALMWRCLGALAAALIG